jgi:hypothetical protein
MEVAQLGSISWQLLLLAVFVVDEVNQQVLPSSKQFLGKRTAICSFLLSSSLWSFAVLKRPKETCIRRNTIGNTIYSEYHTKLTGCNGHDTDARRFWREFLSPDLNMLLVIRVKSAE